MQMMNEVAQDELDRESPVAGAPKVNVVDEEKEKASKKFELTDKTNRMPSLSYLNLESTPGQSTLEQSLPKVLSNPEISDHIRLVYYRL